MLQNKIYQNYLQEVIKTFLIILFGLSIIALTVRAVSFLDLIVENGYPIASYFKYSFLNLFGIIPKFIPLSFTIALSIFILKHIKDSELLILWTSGIKKMEIVNLFFFISILILVFYLVLTTLLTPYALNKSRQILGQENSNSFLPTVRSQQFSDSFKGFTFIVEKKLNNELQNIFLYDKGNNLKNLSSNSSKTKDTTILAKTGLIEKKKLFLFNGQIITSKENVSKNEIIKFEQLIIDLSNLSSTTIKKPKLQETSSIKLINCFTKQNFNNKFCNNDYKQEILATLNRRLVMPFYIPVLSLICSMLLIKTEKFYLNKISIFFYSFTLLIFTELAVRYTGINNIMKYLFIIIPITLFILTYLFLILKFSQEAGKNE
tara:strand:- start:13242 stop:14369 length:1128 start_codon:yes stop_codon:yes gene_type:complete